MDRDRLARQMLEVYRQVMKTAASCTVAHNRYLMTARPEDLAECTRLDGEVAGLRNKLSSMQDEFKHTEVIT